VSSEVVVVWVGVGFKVKRQGQEIEGSPEEEREDLATMNGTISIGMSLNSEIAQYQLRRTI